MIGVSAEDILAKEYDPLRWIIPGVLPEGMTILGGRPKAGKSWLTLGFSIAVATGGAALGEIPVEVGDVLYVDLENGQRRIRDRIRTMLPSEGNRPRLDRFRILEELPRLDAGGLDRLDEWRQAVTHPRLVVVDVLQRVRPAPKKGQDAYTNDYNALAPVQNWAMRHRIGLVLIHHLRKGAEVDDQLEALSGSNGIAATADTALVLNRRGGLVSLYGRGRDLEEIEAALRFDDGVWSRIGEAETVRGSGVDRAILQALREGQTKPAGIAAVIGSTANYVTKRLHHLRLAGEVVNLAFGQYAAADASGNSGKSRKTGKSAEREDGGKSRKSGKSEPAGGEKEIAAKEEENINDNKGDEILPSIEKQESSPTLPTVPALPSVPESDGEAGPQRPAPSTASSDRITAGDVTDVIGLDQPDDAMRLIRWLANRDDAGQPVNNTDVLYSSGLSAPNLRAVAPALRGAGLLSVEELSGEGGKTTRHWRVTPTCLDRLAAARRDRLAREEAEREAANPQINLFNEVA